ncbi:TPA: hypothetical protein QCI14_004627, partial [Enterobacter ludwigii]|nr:hypothetical protein [Enterobacter ludwigii]
MSPDDYLNFPMREPGFGTGVAESTQLNTVWRQASVIAATFAQYVADRTGKDVLDDGDMAALLTLTKEALNAVQSVTAGNNTHKPGATGDVKLGSAADADIVTSMTDTTAGRATVVGWMGTGGPEIPIPDGTDIYKYFATAASGNYGGGSGLINAATTSGWVGFKWQQHGAGNKYGFLLEQASSGQMALHIYNNQNGDMTSPEKYWSNSGLLFSVKNPPTAVQTGALP